MRHPLSEKLKRLIRPLQYKIFHRSGMRFSCPICGYQGSFKNKRISPSPNILRINSKCPSCASTERHRMMHLVVDELFKDWKPETKSLLHIAPEQCLKNVLSERFGTYHTADLLKKDVDFNEDIQNMSFKNESYDCVVVSRVLTIPPDLEASLREIQRILRPDGLAIIAEIYKHDEIQEFGSMVDGRSRKIGIGLLEKLTQYFDHVDCYLSNRYDAKYQLANMMLLDGKPLDNFPEKVRIPGIGFMELVAVCHVDSEIIA